jgi:outer membrane protein assembly factor BamD (BamD/ComL family)
MPERDPPVATPHAAGRLLRGDGEALPVAERLAEEGDRVAALVCGYWRQAADADCALEHLHRAADAGNPVAEGVIARRPGLQAVNAAIAGLPRWVEPVVQPLVVVLLVATLAGALAWVWWGADTPRFMYDDALVALREGDLRGAKLALGEVSRTYTRSRWAPRAKGGSLVLRGWELWKSGSFEAAQAAVQEAGQYPTEDFADRYEQLQRTLAAEQEAQELHEQGLAAERTHDFAGARTYYRRVLNEYKHCRYAQPSRQRLEALPEAERLYEQARAALRTRDWDRTVELCRQIEALDIRSYKVAVTAAEACEGYASPRWSLAALWWSKALSIHDTPDVQRRALNAARHCSAANRDPLEIRTSGMLVAEDRARIEVTLRNVGDHALWGIRFVVTTGAEMQAYNELVIPNADDALEPGESRSFTAEVLMYGSRSYGYHYSDVRKLKRR